VNKVVLMTGEPTTFFGE